ncbi:hypothetical protein N0V83_010564 [Neocucurbitaria cava]|uniref:Uncharacterized protein n=1 Tax=Neocucurbitaria cava TaxID=798079 RepID=A0A9W8XYK5_9PLEO|nr:hypothetical protein N0V83_010564 [Neocucurbitaria cava]
MATYVLDSKITMFSDSEHWARATTSKRQAEHEWLWGLTDAKEAKKIAADQKLRDKDAKKREEFENKQQLKEQKKKDKERAKAKKKERKEEKRQQKRAKKQQRKREKQAKAEQ